MAQTFDLGNVVGPTGPAGKDGKDGYIPTFELDEDGNLYVITPDDAMNDLKFTLSESGDLYYEILTSEEAAGTHG